MNHLAQLAAPLLAAAWLSPVGQQATQAPAADDERDRPRIVEKLATAHDETQQYALFLPSGYGAGEREWPVLFVLDPRGRAMPGIERFREAAERHGYVILSSYQSRSDTFRDVNYHALDALLLDAQRRLRPNMKRLYLAGMSGTAHAAWRFGQILEENIAGVIAAVGGVQTTTQGPPGDARFAYYGITGTTDFNYQEVMRLETHMLERRIDHRIEVFDGRHGWPPHEYTNRALDWMELQAVKRGLAPADPELVDSALARARVAVAAADDPLAELRRTRDVVLDFGGLRDVTAETQALRRLEGDPRVAKRRAQEKRLARAESVYLSQRYGPWLAKMQNRQIRPPTVKESLLALRIEPLRKRAADRDNLPEAHSALRTLESLYTGVAFYLTDQFKKAGDQDRVVRALEVAVEIFPHHVRAQWSLAEAYAESGRLDEAMTTLRVATSFGRVDLERLKTDPTWEPLRVRPEWGELVATLERASG